MTLVLVMVKVELLNTQKHTAAIDGSRKRHYKPKAIEKKKQTKRFLQNAQSYTRIEEKHVNKSKKKTKMFRIGLDMYIHIHT